jgi:hypothetical protein
MNSAKIVQDLSTPGTPMPDTSIKPVSSAKRSRWQQENSAPAGKLMHGTMMDAPAAGKERSEHEEARKWDP